MPKTRRIAYDAAFKLNAISLAIDKGNRAAAQELGINESMVRRWRKQQGDRYFQEVYAAYSLPRLMCG